MDSYSTTLLDLGRRARALRIVRELKQGDLAARAGLAPGTVVRFERTGRASIENVLRIATVLGAEDGFAKLFELPRYRTLDEALARPAADERQRVRTRRRR
jgi:transcriptional regulator with XRE-family HTH domain